MRAARGGDVRCHIPEARKEDAIIFPREHVMAGGPVKSAVRMDEKKAVFTLKKSVSVVQ